MSRSVGFIAIILYLFIVGLPSTGMLYDMNDVNSFSTNGTDILYTCAKGSCGGDVGEEEDNH